MLRVAKYRMLGLAGLVVAVVVASVGVANALAEEPPVTKPAFARCAQVTEANTGNFEMRNTKGECEKGKSGSGFIKAYITAKTEAAHPTVECAQVVELGTGNYETFNKGTCEKAKTPGEYIRVEAAKLGFTSTSGASELATVGGNVVKCTADSDTGDITGPKTVGKVVVTFTTCTGPSSTTCTTSGQSSGTIKGNPLKGTLEYLKGTNAKGTKNVGILFEPESGTEFATFNCELLGNGSKITVTGSLICPVAETNEVTTKTTLTCNETSGKQEITEIEGSTEKHVLTTTGTKIGSLGKAFGPEESGEKTTDTITTEEPGEIKA
jgi:hypothetical protein